MERDEFLNWLIKRGLQRRSAKDVCSRLKRAEKWVDLKQAHDPQLLIYFLEKNEDFKGLGPSVRSHIKRSIRLYSEFLRERGTGTDPSRGE